jgi:hypothetical protein
MDSNGDSLMTWDELAAYFQNAEKKVFSAMPVEIIYVNTIVKEGDI